MKKYIRTALLAALLLAVCGIALAGEAALDRFDFATTDLDGNAVSSADIYAGNRITMVNFWATWCPPCVRELGELTEIHSQLQQMSCGVIGILIDDDLEEAHALMAKNGTNYPVLLLSKDMNGLARTVTAIPTTYFVDATGAVVGEPIIGAYVDRYVPAVETLLGEQAG